MNQTTKTNFKLALLFAAVLAALLWLDSRAYPQQKMGAISTPQINTDYYVGATPGYYASIQSAITRACGTTGGRVVIPAAASPTDTIAAVTGGCTSVTIEDRRAAPLAWYVWSISGGNYQAVAALSAPGTVRQVQTTDGAGHLAATPVTVDSAGNSTVPGYFYHVQSNPVYNTSDPYNTYSSHYHSITANNIVNPSGQNYSVVGEHQNLLINTPGKSLGNIGGFTFGTGWTVHKNTQYEMLSASPGIMQQRSCWLVHTAPGDTFCGYDYVFVYGGGSGASDEYGAETAGQVQEPLNTYQGTLTAGAGTGSTQITTNPTQDQGNQGDDRYIYDVTVSPIVTSFIKSISCSGTNNAAGCTVTINDPIPSAYVATGDGTLDYAIDVAPMNNSPFKIVGTVTVANNTGTFNVGDLVCLTGNNPECSPVLSGSPAWNSTTTYPAGASVTYGGNLWESTPPDLNHPNLNQIPSSSPSYWTQFPTPGSGHQRVTLNLGYSHAIGSRITQSKGGAMILDLTANQVAAAGVSGGYLHFPNYCYGASSTTTLLCVDQFYGNTLGFDLGNVTQQVSSATSSITNTGGTVTITLSTPAADTIFNGQSSVYISGVTPSAFNGVCTNASFNSSYQLTCTQAASTGLTATVQGSLTIGDTGYGNTRFTLRPAARTLDVRNPSTHLTDGSFTVEANGIPFTNGDVIEQLHGFLNPINKNHSYTQQLNPHQQQYNAGTDDRINGYGSTALVGASLHTGHSQAYINQMVGGGGTKMPPYGIRLLDDQNPSGGANGAWSTALYRQHAPWPIGTANEYVGCPATAAGCSDPIYWYPTATYAGNSGGYQMDYYPNTNTLKQHGGSNGITQFYNVQALYGTPGYQMVREDGSKIAWTEVYGVPQAMWGNGTVGDSSAAMSAGKWAAGNLVAGADVPTIVGAFNSVGGGSTTFTYACTSVTANGESLPTTNMTISTAPATLSGSAINYAKCEPGAGATSINVYRTTTVGSYAAGKVCSNLTAAQSYTCNDTGLTASGAVPTTDTTGNLKLSGATATGILGSGPQLLSAITATTGSIGGSSLASGACATGTATISGGTVGHPVSVSTSDGSDIGGGFLYRGLVTNATTVTVYVCDVSSGASTPAAKTYNILTY